MKEDVFENENDMTVKQIREKAVNMKTGWAKTEALLDDQNKFGFEAGGERGLGQ